LEKEGTLNEDFNKKKLYCFPMSNMLGKKMLIFDIKAKHVKIDSMV
tara:strand:+ start:3467 stop:3604 length:138 start_codon:yes stop_codon:yes gene_type:complete